MKILIFRSSFFAHIEEIVNYVQNKYAATPDIFVHEDDVKRYEKIELVNNIISYSGKKEFLLNDILRGKIGEFKKTDYERVIIPCSNKGAFGYNNVFKVANSITNRKKIIFIDQDLNITKPSILWQIKQMLLLCIVCFAKVIDFTFKKIPRKKDTVLAISIDYLGDTVSTIRAVKSLDQINRSKVTVLLKEEYATLLENESGIKYVLLKKSIFSKIILVVRFVFLMRFEKAAIMFPGKNRFELISLLLGIPKRIGYPSPMFYHPFSFVCNKHLTHQAKKDLVDYALYPVLQSLNVNTENRAYPKLEQPVSSSIDKKVVEILMVPCSGWIHRKISSDNLVMMIKEINSSLKEKVKVTIYSTNEYNYKIENKLSDDIKQKVSLVEYYSNMNDLLGFVKDYQYVIGINTGILHLASALDKKVFCVIGPSPLFTSMPLNESKTYYVEDVPCRPCKQYGWEECPKEMFCLKEIDYKVIAEDVILEAGLKTPSMRNWTQINADEKNSR